MGQDQNPSPKLVPERRVSEDMTTSPSKPNRPKGSPKGVKGAGGASGRGKGKGKDNGKGIG
eukprot:12255391-Prorocentrum_lima.AAC.1